MKNFIIIIFIMHLLIFFGYAYGDEKPRHDKGVENQNSEAILFTSVDDAFSALLNENSHLQWEASRYLKEHPEDATDKLKDLIKQKDPSWIMAMSTLTSIGGNTVVKFYCDLLEENHYERDENGKKKVYGLGSPNGCMVMPYLFGGCIVEQLGQLGDRTADPYLQRAWLDGDFGVRSKVPMARFDIGAITIDDLKKLSVLKEKEKNIYLNTLNEIACYRQITNIDEAIDIYHFVISLPESENYIRENAHMSLINCYKSKKDFTKALIHCNWMIDSADSKEISDRCKLQRIILQFNQGTLSQNNIFDLAKSENELYSWIASSARLQDTSIFNRIIKEAPAGSKYADEAQYWKYEYFEGYNMNEQAKIQSDFILQNCKDKNVLDWIRGKIAKNNEKAERISRNRIK